MAIRKNKTKSTPAGFRVIDSIFVQCLLEISFAVIVKQEAHFKRF